MAIELPEECYELILTKLRAYYLDDLSLVSKQFLLITNRLRTGLTVFNHSIQALSLLFRRFNCLHTIDFTGFHGELDLGICEIARSNLEIKELNISNKNNIPLEGLSELGLKKISLKVLKCSNVRLLCDDDLVLLGTCLPFLEEINLSYPVDNNDLGNSLHSSSITDIGIEKLSSILRSLHKIDISGNYQLSDRSLVALSMNCISMSEIKFRGCSFVTQNGIEFAICHCSNLVSLNVNGFGIHAFESSDSPSLAIGGSIFHGRLLNELVFSSMTIPDVVLVSISEAKLPLKKLTLYSCRGFTFSGISTLLEVYQDLSELSLEETAFITDEHMNELCQFLCNVNTINLSGCFNLTGATLLTLASQCRRLHGVTMENTCLGMEDLCVDLVENYSLTDLKVGSNHCLGDETVEKLGYIFPQLHVLDVANCKEITNKGIMAVLRCCKGITHLDISTCERVSLIYLEHFDSCLEVLMAAGSGIDDLGMDMIGRSCRRLLVLDLGSCVISEKGVKKMLRRCKSLREINLAKCCNIRSSLASLVFSGGSLRKIVPPCKCMCSESEKNLYTRHGCMILEEPVVF